MSKNLSRYEVFKDSSLSQQLSKKYPEYNIYAGADPKISERIAKIRVLCKLGYLDKNDPNIKLILLLLNERRKALFATSEKVNEISKMGMQLPKALLEFLADNQESEENELSDIDILFEDYETRKDDPVSI